MSVSIQPRSFLESAERYVANDEEVCFRNAVSRAYYTAYHLAKPLGDKLPYVATSGGMHAQMIKKFTDYHAPTNDSFSRSRQQAIRRIGLRLKEFHEARVIADYHLDESVTRAFAKKWIIHCKNLINDLENL